MVKRPGNEFNIVDNSGRYTPVETKVVSPLQLIAASFDKGPEDLIEVSGDDFFRMFGEDISFERHGQPALQAANVILNGGNLAVKRVVADDATLANAIVLATVKKSQAYKVDLTTGKAIYIDKDTGAETTEWRSSTGENNDRAVINTADITYSVTSVTGIKNMHELELAAASLVVERDPIIPGTDGGNTTDEDTGINTQPEEAGSGIPSAIPANIPFPIGSLGDEATAYEYTYPIIIVGDNGRGVSSKRFNIEPDYAISRNTGFALYKITNIGDLNLDSEYERFALPNGTLYAGKSMTLTEVGKQMKQIRPIGYKKGIDLFINKVSEFSGIDVSTLNTVDILFGKDAKGFDLPQITVNTEGYDLSSSFGISLYGGDNGVFGDAPFGTPEYDQKLIDFFSGEEDPAVFDVEEWMFEVVVDANYSFEVKKVITELADFRGDFTYFRDCGLGLESFDAIRLVASNLTNSRYATNYCQSYNTIDPFTLDEVTVTIGYDIARLLIDHLNNYRNAPFSGLLYNVAIDNVIDGTVSYIPRIKPSIDQKQQLYDIHMNYASMVNGRFVIETQINSQPDITQCSWVNNILLIQNVIREIRKRCPRVRYSFIDRGEGLNTYANDINEVLNAFSGQFNSLSFEWSSDEMELANHIFNATIVVSFKQYVDYEKFTISVIDGGV